MTQAEHTGGHLWAPWNGHLFCERCGVTRFGSTLDAEPCPLDIYRPARARPPESAP